MATATQRAAMGAQEGRMEGKGLGGQAVEAARNVATGRDQPGLTGPGHNNHGVGHNGATGVTDRGIFDHHNRDHHLGGGLHGGQMLGNTEEEMSRLRTKTHITHEGDAYCPNPNIRDLPREFETRVQVIQRYPEMKTVEKTDFVKEIHHEERTIIVARTRIIHDDIERIDRVPVVRQIPRVRIEMHYRTVTEEREVMDMVQQIDYVDIPRIEMVPRVITEDVEERVIVPVVREVPVTRMVEVPTGNYCEAPAGTFIAAGDFDLLKLGLGGVGGTKTHSHGHHKGAAVGAGAGAGAAAGGGILGGGLGGLMHEDKSKGSRGTSSSSSSSSSDDENSGRVRPVVRNADGTVTPGGRRKKSLLQRVMHK